MLRTAATPDDGDDLEIPDTTDGVEFDKSKGQPPADDDEPPASQHDPAASAREDADYGTGAIDDDVRAELAADAEENEGTDDPKAEKKAKRTASNRNWTIGDTKELLTYVVAYAKKFGRPALSNNSKTALPDCWARIRAGLDQLSILPGRDPKALHNRLKAIAPMLTVRTAFATDLSRH